MIVVSRQIQSDAWQSEEAAEDPGDSPADTAAETLAAPTAADAADVWRLVEATPALDGNSAYAYLLLCSHFADTGLVARREGELVGFVLGYVRPGDSEAAFVWQVAVAPQAQGSGLGGRLLDAWFARCVRHAGVRYLEATVTPSNRASRALFAAFARRHDAPLEEGVVFPAALFPGDTPHEQEIGVRIGPLSPSRGDPRPSQETH